jgi:hypothetical protein
MKSKRRISNILKNSILVLIILLSTACYTSAQDDSVIHTQDLIISYEDLKYAKNKSADSIASPKIDTAEISNIETVIFLKNDSLIIQKMVGLQKGPPIEKLFKKERKGALFQKGINIDRLLEARFETGSLMTVGIVTGAVVGGVAGYFMGDAFLFKSATSGLFKKFLIISSALLGATACAIIGGLIGNEMKSYDYLDLWQIPKKYKRIKLIRFLREHERKF